MNKSESRKNLKELNKELRSKEKNWKFKTKKNRGKIYESKRRLANEIPSMHKIPEGKKNTEWKNCKKKNTKG